MESVKYGIWSVVSKKFVFGIKEPSKTKARKALFNEIGKDSYKHRFEVKKIPSSFKPKKSMQEKLNHRAEEVIAIMKKHGVVVQRYDAYSTNSIYLKFDYGVCNSLRISDHKGKKHLSYRYNLMEGISKAYTEHTSNGWEMHFYPASQAQNLAFKILKDREHKIINYGLGRYKQFMHDNKVNNQEARGFWEQAIIL